jgi:alpha-mannosidase
METNKPAASTRGMDEILGRWREEVKGKQRRVYSFEEQADFKLKDLKERVYADREPADGWLMRQCYYRGVGDYEYIDADWREIRVGGSWGGADVSCFFRRAVEIPERMAGRKVVLRLYLGGDSLVSLDGEPHQGLDPFRNVVPLRAPAAGGERIEVAVESYYMWHFGESETKTFECAEIAAVDEAIEELYWDYRAAYNGLAIPDGDPRLRGHLEAVLKEAVACLDPYETDAAAYLAKARAGRDRLRAALAEGEHFRLPGKLHLVGNSHLDLVFLWPYREFIRKVGRTHASMLRLMEEFPDFKFSQSQPALYREMKTHFPDLYRQVKERVREGRWEVIGAMWVEPDCNLVSGESLVRQILVGSRFIRAEFGIEPRTCWLPDVFGNCYTMPQILAKSGLEFFVTHKMCVWNDTNPWRTHTFWWEGPDGSRVFAVSPPTHFIGTVEPDHLAAHWDKFADKESVGESLYCYGWGDGGGGVDAEMLQYAARYRSFPGLPETVQTTAEAALDSMRARAGKIPVWKDELYLEAHRGVYTTKGELKRLNRYCENLYREAELYAVLAALDGAAYPKERLDAGWEKVLTNQFHDALPGSHTGEVYLDILTDYAAAVAIGEDVRSAALARLAQNAAPGAGPADGGAADGFAVFNSAPRPVDTLVRLPAGGGAAPAAVDGGGTRLPCQTVENLKGERNVVFAAAGLPAVGYRRYRLRPAAAAPAEPAAGARAAPTAAPTVLENRFFRLTFGADGELDSIVDRRYGREVLAPGGRGNVFRLYEDIPSKYEAWDIVETYRDRELPLGPAVLSPADDGPVCRSVLLERSFFASRLRQKIVLYDAIPRIDFETEVDWRERRKLLKVGFDVDVAAKEFTSDIAYGTIARPNYRYDSFAKAKFEVCAHAWIDLSQDDYGVGLLNDCKYGHEVTERTMRLTLLKGPTNPDPESDLGVHYFTYSLFPHAGDWRRGGVAEAARALNVPALPVPAGAALPDERSYLGVDAADVSLEAVKMAEDGGAVVVRLVERWNRRSYARLRLPRPVARAVVCDLMERPLAEADGQRAEWREAEVRVELKPCEIVTLRIEFA